MSKTNLKNHSWDELKKLAHFNPEGKKPEAVQKSLPKLLKTAQKGLKDGNEEETFVYFTRWLITMKWLQKEDKNFNFQKTDLEQIKKAEHIVTKLSEKLEIEHSPKLKKTLFKTRDSIDQVDLNILPSINEKDKVFSDIPLEFPETPTDDPLNTEVEELVSCTQLYQIMQHEDQRYLIIDIRPQSDYEKSKIRTSKCINIPKNIIVPENTMLIPSHCEKYLSKNPKSYDLFRQRGARYVDTVILLDWETKKESKTDKPENSLNKHLNMFKDMLLQWDLSTSYKKVVILDGGYKEWLTRYPAHTTNPKVVITQLDEVSSDDFVLPCYPSDIDKEDEHSKKQSQIKSNAIKEKSIIHDALDDRQLFNGYESRVNSTTSSLFSNNNINASIPLTTVKNTSINKSGYGDAANQYKNNNNRPIIDRSSKPIISKAPDPASKEVLRLMKQLNESGKEMEKLQRRIYETETTLYKENVKNTSSREDSTIQTDLKSMNSEFYKLQKTYNENEKELNTYKEKGTIEFTDEQQEEKNELDFNLLKARQRLKDIKGHRRRLQESFLEKDHKDTSLKQNEKDVHMEPLKTESSITSGLERSHSSPNLMQMRDHKAPEVDRSSKPQIASQYFHNHLNNEINRVQRSNWGSLEEKITPIHGNVHPGITGLKNLGNSCYMNSIIQCLSNTPKLSTYFIDNLYADDLNRNNENISQTQVVTNVAEVIRALWAGQYKRISPHCLKAAIGQYKLQFSSYEQQDSHEFLTFLLDWMHSELRKKVKIQAKMTTAEKEWDKAMDSQESIISELFFGQLRSTITCSSCQKDSTTYETFNSLTMSLPHTSKCTLDDCIQRFVTGQKVVGWKCPKCLAPREATKKFDFIKLAPIIVIHLNRFAESGGWLEKRNTAVDFPLKDFNLRPYLITDHDAPMNNARFCTYNLYAISNHYGTMEGGHYTAFCKNSIQNKWYKYDDQTVTEISPSQVKSQTSSAYLLFYTSLSNTYI